MQLGSGNGTSFPTSVDTATTEVNAPASGKTKARAEVINDILAALVAIETYLNTTYYPTTQDVVTGSRVIGTVYQNITGRPMYVSVSFSTDGAAPLSLAAYTDSNNPPTTAVKQVQTGATSQLMPVDFWVLPGNYYKVTVQSGTPSLQVWTEWY